MNTSFETNKAFVEENLKSVRTLVFYAKDKRLLSVYYTVSKDVFDSMNTDETRNIFQSYILADVQKLFDDAKFKLADIYLDPIMNTVYFRYRRLHKKGASEETPHSWEILQRNFNYGKMFYL